MANSYVVVRNGDRVLNSKTTGLQCNGKAEAEAMINRALDRGDSVKAYKVVGECEITSRSSVALLDPQ